MTMRRFGFLTAMLLLLATDREAAAHAFLLKSDPTVGATVMDPKTLRLEFSEAIELGFSGVDLATSPGGALALNGLHFADEAHKVLVAGLPMLTAGAYRVRWHVVSVDTHRTEGEFGFTVKP
jgi:hypothetical protein